MKKLRLFLPNIVTLRKILRRGWGFLFTACMFAFAPSGFATDRASAGVDQGLRAALVGQGFTGKVESILEQRLGRPLDPAKAELGRLLFFDKFVGLHGDNFCDGPLDPRALPENLARLIPKAVPSRLPLHTFESTPPTP